MDKLMVKHILFLHLLAFLLFACSGTLTLQRAADFEPEEVQYIELPQNVADQSEMLTSEERSTIVKFLQEVNQAEIDAGAQLSIDLVENYFSGDRLETMKLSIEEFKDLKTKGATKTLDFDKTQSYYLDMWFTSPSTVRVEACEYWKIILYDENGEVQWLDDWHLTPALKDIELNNSSPRIYQTSLLDGNAFCFGKVDLDVPNLPESSNPKIEAADRDLIIDFLYQTSQAETVAMEQLDISAAEGFYSEKMLGLIEQSIEESREMRARGDIKVIEYDREQSHYLDMIFLDSSTVSVQACEFWKTVIYDERGDIVWGSEWELFAQSIEVEFIGNPLKVLDVVLHADDSFCDQTIAFDEDIDETRFPVVAPTKSVPVYVPTGDTGQITWEKWNITWPEGVETLRNDRGYPNNPDESSTLTSLEAMQNQGDLFGQRISGYIYPPITGTYTFWIAGDNFAELWLSNTSDPTEIVLIASVPNFTAFREWERYPAQQSVEIVLQEGKPYYIEALNTEGGEEDHLSVAWEIPGQSRRVIGGQYLEPAGP